MAPVVPIGQRGSESLVPPEEDICVYRKDSLLRFLQSHANVFTPLLTFGCYLFLFMGVKAIVAYWSGVLSAPGLSQVEPDDVRRYPPFLLVFGRFMNSKPLPIATPAMFPYLRDYSELLLMALMAAQMVLIQRLWFDLSIALRHLYAKGTIIATQFTAMRYAELVRRYDRYFNLRIWKLLSIVLAVFLVAGVYFTAYTYGIYPSLSPANDIGWVHAAYDSWWANPASHRMLFLYAFAIATFICYYMIRNDIVGLIAVGLCCSIFSRAKRRRHQPHQPLLKLDPSNPDGVAGLGILREILLLTYFSVFNSFLSLFVIYCCVGLQRGTIPIYVVFVLLNPVFLVIPALVIRREVRQSKNNQLETWYREIRNLCEGSTNDSACSKIHVREDWISKLKNVPDCLITPRGAIAGFFFYYIPALGFIDLIVKG